jgi:hypothetical protein
VAIPDIDPMVAMPVLPLVQRPPTIVSVSAVVAPTHTFKVPVIMEGGGVTITKNAIVLDADIGQLLSLNVT